MNMLTAKMELEAQQDLACIFLPDDMQTNRLNTEMCSA